MATLHEGFNGDGMGYINGTYDHGLDFTSTVNEHTHPMSGRLVTRSVVGQNKGKIHGIFVCIRNKVPLLLWLIVNLVCTGAQAAELKEMINAILCGKMQIILTCLGESSEESEDDCSWKGLSIGGK